MKKLSCIIQVVTVTCLVFTIAYFYYATDIKKGEPHQLHGSSRQTNTNGENETNFFQQVEKTVLKEINNTRKPLLTPKSDSNVHFITYGDKKYLKSKLRLSKQAEDTHWFASVKGFGPEDLPPDFAEDYKDVLKLRRGGGYWIWKYPIIEQTLVKMNEGDFIVYLDAGCSVNPLGKKRFDEYLAMIEKSDKDILSFRLRSFEYKYTTEKIFQHFNVSKNSTIRTSKQYVGGVLVLRKGKHLYKWLQLVKHTLQANRWLFTDKYNKEAKQLDPEFIDNRHDQSVSSVSRKIVGSIVIDDETYPSNQKQYPFWASRIR